MSLPSLGLNTIDATQYIAGLVADALRYRWLRAGNAYSPEECGITGGTELDKLCDSGILIDNRKKTI